MVTGSATRRVKIDSLATFVPPRLLTNADLERMVETTDEWILQRTGIRERHVVDAGVATSDLAAEAAREAIAKAGLRPDQIELIIVGTTTPDTIFPSTACLVQHKIGATRAAAAPRSDVATPGSTIWRSRMPVRCRIHSSVVSTSFSRSALVSTRGGT